MRWEVISRKPLKLSRTRTLQSLLLGPSLLHFRKDNVICYTYFFASYTFYPRNYLTLLPVPKWPQFYNPHIQRKINWGYLSIRLFSPSPPMKRSAVSADLKFLGTSQQYLRSCCVPEWKDYLCGCLLALLLREMQDQQQWWVRSFMFSVTAHSHCVLKMYVSFSL